MAPCTGRMEEDPSLSSFGLLPLPGSSRGQHRTGLRFDLTPHGGTVQELSCAEQWSSAYWFQRAWKTI